MRRVMRPAPETLPASLAIGEASESVTVDANPLLNATDTTNGYVLDKQQIESIPGVIVITDDVTGLNDANYEIRGFTNDEIGVTVNGADGIARGYDGDGLLTSVGGLTLSRDAQTGIQTPHYILKSYFRTGKLNSYISLLYIFNGNFCGCTLDRLDDDLTGFFIGLYFRIFNDLLL